MNISQPTIFCGLTAQATPAGISNASKATIGGSSSHRPSAANVIYAITATAAATGDRALLHVATGDVEQAVGNPVIADAGTDFQGLDLGTATKLHGIRLRTPAANSQSVGIQSTCDNLPAIVLPPDSDLTLKLPAAGITLLGSEQLLAIFGNAGDVLQVEVLSKV